MSLQQVFELSMLEKSIFLHFFHFFDHIFSIPGPLTEFCRTCAIHHFFCLFWRNERLVFKIFRRKRLRDKWSNIEIFRSKKCKKFYILIHCWRIFHPIDVLIVSFKSLSLYLSVKKFLKKVEKCINESNLKKYTKKSTLWHRWSNPLMIGTKILEYYCWFLLPHTPTTNKFIFERFKLMLRSNKQTNKHTHTHRHTKALFHEKHGFSFKYL